MLKIKDRSLVPPGGFRYFQKETKAPLSAGSHEEWLKKVADHRIGNKLPLDPDFWKEVEDFLCRSLPSNSDHCEHYDERALPLEARRIGVDDLKNFLRVMKAWLTENPTYVDQAEAERRAGICARCPLNVVVEGCWGCTGIANLVTGLLGNRSTSQDSRLNGCQVCGCALKAAVHIPLEVQQRGLSQEAQSQFPDWCWKAVT